MLTTKRTTYSDNDFQTLVKALDADLKIGDGEEHDFYNQFNKIDMIQYAVVAYNGEAAVSADKFQIPNHRNTCSLYVLRHYGTQLP